jgi:hypothetical protein
MLFHCISTLPQQADRRAADSSSSGGPKYNSQAALCLLKRAWTEEQKTTGTALLPRLKPTTDPCPPHAS